MLEDQDLVNLYNEAALFACPSVYEPFGIINLEAMACETPVVATRVGGIKEVVVDEENGLLVPPADPAKLGRAMTRILEDPALGTRMGKAGRKHVFKHFTWDRIAGKTLDLYRSLT
jgi:glycosyltransferase involved in cell wall biosynthesis